MRQFFLVLTGLSLLALCTAAPSAATVEVRTIRQEVYAGDVGKVEIDLSIGDLKVEGTSGSEVEIEVKLFCSRENVEKCTARAQRLYLVPRRRGSRLDVLLKRTSAARAQGIQAEMTVKMPRHLELEVDLKGGDVVINGIENGIEINGVAGDVDITHRRHLVGQVNVDVGIGKVDLWLGDGRIEGTGFPRSLKWTGTGAAPIDVNLGNGKVNLRLDG